MIHAMVFFFSQPTLSTVDFAAELNMHLNKQILLGHFWRRFQTKNDLKNLQVNECVTPPLATKYSWRDLRNAKLVVNSSHFSVVHFFIKFYD